MRSPKATIDLCLQCSASKEEAEKDVSLLWFHKFAVHFMYHSVESWAMHNIIPERLRMVSL